MPQQRQMLVITGDGSDWDSGWKQMLQHSPWLMLFRSRTAPGNLGYRGLALLGVTMKQKTSSKIASSEHLVTICNARHSLCYHVTYTVLVT